MAAPQVCLFALKSLNFLWNDIAPPCGRLMMYKAGEWRPQHFVTCSPRPQAKINVIIGYGEVILIKMPDRLHACPGHKHTGARDGGKLLPDPEAPHGSRKVRRRPDEPMPRQVAKTHDHPSMLKGAIRLEQLRAHDAGAIVAHARHHLLQPIGVQHLHIIV